MRVGSGGPRRELRPERRGLGDYELSRARTRVARSMTDAVSIRWDDPIGVGRRRAQGSRSTMTKRVRAAQMRGRGATEDGLERQRFQT